MAREAVKHAAEEGYDCVLIDTAGRMQVRAEPCASCVKRHLHSITNRLGVEAVGEVGRGARLDIERASLTFFTTFSIEVA